MGLEPTAPRSKVIHATNVNQSGALCDRFLKQINFYFPSPLKKIPALLKFPWPLRCPPHCPAGVGQNLLSTIFWSWAPALWVEAHVVYCIRRKDILGTSGAWFSHYCFIHQKREQKSKKKISPCLFSVAAKIPNHPQKANGISYPVGFHILLGAGPSCLPSPLLSTARWKQKDRPGTWASVHHPLDSLQSACHI